MEPLSWAPYLGRVTARVATDSARFLDEAYALGLSSTRVEETSAETAPALDLDIRAAHNAITTIARTSATLNGGAIGEKCAVPP